MSENNDNNNQPAPNEEEFPSRPGSVLEKEGSLNSSMITIIVSPAKLLYTVFFTRFFFLQVNDIQFRLDSHFLERESETLKAIITESESDSIRLNDISAAEFRALWRFFYEG